MNNVTLAMRVSPIIGDSGDFACKQRRVQTTSRTPDPEPWANPNLATVGAEAETTVADPLPCPSPG